MDTNKAREILVEYQGRIEIMDLFFLTKDRKMSKADIDALWNHYIDFMVIKTFGCDTGQHNQMEFGNSKVMNY